MSLQTRLAALITAVGADIKTLQTTSNWKTAVRFASNSNVTIAAPGANIDGVAAAIGDRVLLPSQTTASEKGIYVYNGAAVPMTRATDADTTTKLPIGTAVMVTDGNNNKWTTWRYLSGAFAAQIWSTNVYFANTSRIQGNSSQIIVVANGVSYNFDNTGLDLSSKALKSVLDPVNAQDGATKNYVDIVSPAPDLLQAGVVQSGDCALTINTTTQVTIAAGVAVWVRNASGLLVRTQPVSTVLGSIPVASASNFRLDQVVVDSAGVVTRLAGTQGTTVTLANRTGFAAIPAGSQLLHDLLVSSTGVVAANVRDRRSWAGGAYSRIKRTANAAGANDYTTALTAAGNIDATNLSMRVECSGVPLRMILRGRLNNAATSHNRFVPIMDGAAVDGMAATDSPFDYMSAAGSTTDQTVHAVYEFTPAAGSHLFTWQYFVGAGTMTLYARAGLPLFMIVEEVVSQNANNGTT